MCILEVELLWVRQPTSPVAPHLHQGASLLSPRMPPSSHRRPLKKVAADADVERVGRGRRATPGSVGTDAGPRIPSRVKAGGRRLKKAGVVHC